MRHQSLIVALTCLALGGISASYAQWGGGGAAVISSTSSTTPVCSNTSIPAGNTVASTTTETAFSTTCQIPAMNTSGQLVQCQAYGVLTIGATIPTLEGRVKINGSTVLDTAAIPGLVAGSNFGWHAYFSFLVLSPGSTGSIDAQGVLYAQIGTTQELPIPVRNTSPFTVNTLSPITISLTAQFGNALSNSIQLRQLACK